MSDKTAYEALQSRMEDINAMSTADPDDDQWGYDTRDSYALSVEAVYTVDILLAYGGPTEYIRFTFSELDDDDPSATYYYSWASGVDSMTMTDDEAATAWSVLGAGLSYRDAAGITEYNGGMHR